VPVRKLPSAAVGVFFIKGRAQSLRETPADLPVDHSGMKDSAAIMHRHIAVNARHQSGAIDLNAPQKSKMNP